MDWNLHTIWRFIVEITILTVGIYYAIKFIRGMRGRADGPWSLDSRSSWA